VSVFSWNDKGDDRIDDFEGDGCDVGTCDFDPEEPCIKCSVIINDALKVYDEYVWVVVF
jgi:hypothetical protein